MSKMPMGSVDVIVTSPPYNIKNSTGNGLKNGAGGKWPQAGLLKGYTDHDDAMPHEVYVAWQRDCLAAMMRVLREDGAIFYNHKWRIQGGLLQDRADILAGFPVRQIIIWQRKGGINFNPGYFLPTYEVIYLIAKPDFALAPKANAQGMCGAFRKKETTRILRLFQWSLLNAASSPPRGKPCWIPSWALGLRRLQRKTLGATG